MLVDVVLYSGERDLLDARLDMIHADLTVVIEGNKTFTGKPRTIERLPDHVVHVQIDTESDSDPWHNEYCQRRDGYSVLEELDIPDEAMVGFFDVDEIPDPGVLRYSQGLSCWFMAKHQMSLRWFQQKEDTGVSGRWGQIKHLDMAQVRWNRSNLPKLDAGFHLSSFLTVEDLLQKWSGFSHQEFQRLDMADWIAHCWEYGIAIETGLPLDERGLQNIPDRLLSGPEFWLRARPS